MPVIIRVCRWPRRTGFRQFLQAVLSVNATLVAQQQDEEMRDFTEVALAQNSEMQVLTEDALAQNEEVKKISAWAAARFSRDGSVALAEGKLRLD